MKRKKPSASKYSFRSDYVVNDPLGYGTARDKLEKGAFTSRDPLSWTEIDALYYHDDVGAKIVNARPEEMLRRGYKLVSKKNPKGAEELQKRANAADGGLALDKKILDAFRRGRAWGGSVLLIGATDSEDLSKPLEPARAVDVKFLSVVDARRSCVTKYQEDPRLPRFDEPELYQVGSNKTNATELGLAVQFVHASRVVRFDGVEETDPDMRKALNGWTHSVLQRPYDTMRDFATGFKSVGQLLADASQGVWKIQNLLDMLGSNREELIQRMMFADMTRSAGRAVMLDAESEDFARVATSFAGIDVILDRLMMRLASAADMPVTLLMGRSAAGMNATGDSDFRAWYDVLATEQKNNLGPALLYVYRVLSRGAIDDLAVEFAPMWQPSEREQADIRRVNAETHKIYALDIGAYTPEQVAIAEFGSGNGKIEINEERLRGSLDEEVKFSVELEKARGSLGEKELAALSIAQGVSPIIVSSLISAAGRETSAPPTGAPAPAEPKQDENDPGQETPASGEPSVEGDSTG